MSLIKQNPFDIHYNQLIVIEYVRRGDGANSMWFDAHFNLMMANQFNFKLTAYAGLASDFNSAFQYA